MVEKKKVTKKTPNKNGEVVEAVSEKVQERKLEKELLSVLIFMGVLVFIFIIASSFFKSLNTFDYNGLSFQKQRLGEIPVYYHNYVFKALNGKIINYNLYLRNDPREIDSIPVEGDSIHLDQGKAVFVSVDPEKLSPCFYGTLAIASISGFLKDNQFGVQGGNSDFWNAGLKRQDWVTCENHKSNPVIEFAEGNETKIDVSVNCIKVYVNNCEVLQAAERLELEILIDARESSA